MCVDMGKSGLEGHAKKGIVSVTVGLTKSACRGADLLAFLPTQVLQVPIPAIYPTPPVRLLITSR